MNKRNIVQQRPLLDIEIQTLDQHIYFLIGSNTEFDAFLYPIEIEL